LAHEQVFVYALEGRAHVFARPSAGQNYLRIDGGYFLNSTPDQSCTALPPGFIPRLLSCLLYSVSLSYYHYCQFIGYNALPFLDNTVLFLYPVAAIVLVGPTRSAPLYSKKLGGSV